MGCKNRDGAKNFFPCPKIKGGFIMNMYIIKTLIHGKDLMRIQFQSQVLRQ